MKLSGLTLPYKRNIRFSFKIYTNKPLKKIDLFENIEEIENYIENIKLGKKAKLSEIIVNTNYGYKIITIS